jgi:hypothetical protein
METNMITFKSVGHFFAKAFKAIVKELPLIENTKSEVEEVTSVVMPQAVPVENAAYALLGEISSLLTAGGEAAAAKLTDAGLDVNVINQAKSVISSVPNLVALAKKL